MASTTPNLLDQLKEMRKHPLVTVLGCALGGFIPAATYVVAHYEAPQTPHLWLIVAAGLVFSPLTVWQQARGWFGCPYKAFGFVGVLEGVMVFSSTVALTLGALSILVVINGLSVGYSLVGGSAARARRSQGAKKAAATRRKQARRQLQAVA